MVVRRTRARLAALIAGLGLSALLNPSCAGQEETAERRTGKVEFNRDIRPILADKCFACHGPDSGQRQAELRLDQPSAALADRGGSAALVPGRPDASALFTRTTSSDPDERMPPVDSGKELSAAETALLRRWIEEGAEYEPHWSLAPMRYQPLPKVQRPDWPRDPIDNFILARLEAIHRGPAPEADRTTLLRRLYLDLTGLPPTSAQVADFLHDVDERACERTVDQLLASPHFGERMAMFWLDLVRYADSVGYHGDQEHRSSPYRDYVIQAFNDNLPFDRFTQEQLAGDLLPNRTIDQHVASAYNRLLQTSHEGGVQVREYLAKYSADRVRNFGGVWLGVTLGCAECHDHKFDPFSQRDFYRLAAFFADVDDSQTFRGGDSSPTKREPEIDVLDRVDRERLARVNAELAELERRLVAPERAPSTPPESQASTTASDELRARAAELTATIAQIQQTTRRVMVTVAVEPRPIRVLARGDWMDESGETVLPGIPQVFGELPLQGGRATRLDLAAWVTRADNPLTSRVFVNRLWAMFLGAGLCPSLDDAGAQGEPPTHPELLDRLALDFVASGWDVKRLVRRIVTSSTYRQSSTGSHASPLDSKHHLFGRQSRFRLPAELIRDQALAASGLMTRQVGGPSAKPYQPDHYYALLNFPKRTYQSDAGASQYRRGVYMHWQRQFLHPMLRAFDAPSREECTAQRAVSNTPSAALTLLNDPTFVECARVLAARMVREGGDSPEARIRWGWRCVLSRDATGPETQVLAELYAKSLAHYEAHPEAAQALLRVGFAPAPPEIEAAALAAWTAVARALLNLDEAITRA